MLPKRQQQQKVKKWPAKSLDLDPEDSAWKLGRGACIQGSSSNFKKKKNENLRGMEKCPFDDLTRVGPSDAVNP